MTVTNNTMIEHLPKALIMATNLSNAILTPLSCWKKFVMGWSKSVMDNSLSA